MSARRRIVRTMTVLACIATPYLPPEDYLPVARAAEASGLEELWIWEDCFRETGVAATAALLAATERLRIGIGVLPVPLRNVALTAMELATIERMFPGRTVPGVGHGVQTWMEQVGARVGSPLTLLREHVEALRALLGGDRLTVSGRYVTLDDVGLDWPPASPPPLLAAATGPKTLRLVGEIADGVVLTASTGLDGLREAVEQVTAGREAAARTDPFQVVVNVATARSRDQVEAVRAHYAGLGHDVADDAGLARFAVWGSAEQVAEGLRRFAEAGATTLAVQPTLDEADTAGLAAWMGEEVRPLLS